MIATIPKNFTPKVEIIPNFFSEDELKNIEKMFRAGSDLKIQIENYGITMSGNVGNGTQEVRAHYWYPGKSYFDKINQFINKKIKNLHGEAIECENWHILNAFMPYTIHSDSFDELNSSATELPDNYTYAWTYLIPLNDYDTNTIVFNETSNFSKDPKVWIDRLNKQPINSITNEEYEKYLSHEVKEYVSYYSIDKIFPWRKGDLLAMSRHAFHASDNFVAKGLVEKRALIGWSYARYR